MNWADWIILAIVILSSVIALVRGFVKEALSLVIWVIALVVASAFSSRAEVLLEQWISTPSVRAITAFIAIFVVVLLVGALLNFLMGLLVTATGLSGTNRLIGMVFGILRGLFIVMIFLIYVPRYVPIKNDPWFQQSILIPYFSPYESAVKNATTESTHWVMNVLSKSDRK